MFESAEVGNKIDKETYRGAAPQVRAALLAAQHELAGADFSLLIVVAGVEGAGKSETVNLLLEWLDARGIQTHALHEPTDEEAQRPPLWRFWRVLPPKGRIGIFFGSWETNPIHELVEDRLDPRRLDRALDRAVAFERMLSNENTLLVKFWLHLSRKQQKKRLKALEADPRQAWRVTREEWRQYKRYDEYRSASEYVLRRTDAAEAPWVIVEGADRRYRTLTVAQRLLTALRERLDRAKAEPPPAKPEPLVLQPPPVNVINQLDMTLALTPQQYEEQLLQAEGELNRLARRLRKQGRSMILVFEGADAAGKGGAIRRLTAALDARDYRVISVAAPTDEERAHPYLWRFWRQVPPHGKVTIYDRSWYGRVLVERVEGFCAPADWQRAYGEINDFEEQLTEAGVVVVKFWLATTPEEQLRRFQDRQTTPYKQYKITEEDWRNRAKWDSYEAAACTMIEKTSTEAAPWVPVEAENKEWARVKVLETVIHHLQKALGK
jgi:polyphosphate:AMP phosphotransferase